MEVKMNIKITEIVPHPDYLEMLFIHRSKVSNVFKDVLGLYEINHVAISHIDKNHQLLTLSSTPSLEFNLFSGSLWRYDLTYQPSWYNLCAPSSWQSLYTPERYDELYYIKQVKYHYPLGISLPIKLPNSYVIYSIASQKMGHKTQELFENNHELFYKIGHYCSNALLPLFC